MDPNHDPPLVAKQPSPATTISVGSTQNGRVGCVWVELDAEYLLTMLWCFRKGLLPFPCICFRHMTLTRAKHPEIGTYGMRMALQTGSTSSLPGSDYLSIVSQLL